jgi:glycogen synthase
MKIAFVSYEYPPDTAIGGIATYVRQAAQMLSQRGHDVEVFAASPSRSGCETSPGLKVHRIQPRDRASFAQEIAPIFAQRHQLVQFDLLEGPDCGADAAVIAAQFPALPLVVKLHTPSYILQKVGHTPLDGSAKLRFILGALRRGQWPKLPPTQPLYDRQSDPEYHHALQAQTIAAPSQAIGQQVQADWQLDRGIIDPVPYPYIPTPALLEIPLDTQTQRITFIGRLEIRKGILDLMQAIPLVLNQYPAAKFRFVGPAWPSPVKHLNMQEYICQKLHRHIHALEFVGAVPLDQVPQYLAQTDICVFPSIWESFGLVCLEAMAAGRGVVGSSAGGMVELLDGGRAGLLTPPQQPILLAQLILQLLQDPDLRQQYGAIARARVLSHYSLEYIGQIQEASYRSAIDRQVSREIVKL